MLHFNQPDSCATPDEHQGQTTLDQPHPPNLVFSPLGCAQETHQQLADKKSLHVVEFREECGPLPIVVASPQGALRKDPEPEDEVPDIKLDWDDVKAVQGMKRSVWSGLKRAAT